MFSRVLSASLISIHTLHKKWSFPLRISSESVTKSAVFCGFALFTDEILNKKLHSLRSDNLDARFFYKQRFSFFLSQPHCCLTFSWIELQMLLRCCLIHKSIIILRHFLYLLHLCTCLDLGLFMSCQCDLILFFIFILIKINRLILWTQRHLFFCLFFRMCPIVLDDHVDEEYE